MAIAKAEKCVHSVCFVYDNVEQVVQHPVGGQWKRRRPSIVCADTPAAGAQRPKRNVFSSW
jgi:hypothetical protein